MIHCRVPASYPDVSLLKKSVGAQGKKGTRSSPVARASRSSRETPENEAGHEHNSTGELLRNFVLLRLFYTFMCFLTIITILEFVLYLALILGNSLKTTSVSWSLLLTYCSLTIIRRRRSKYWGIFTEPKAR